MQIFGILNPKEYTIEDLYTSPPISWELLSGSNGITVTSPNEFEGAVTIQRASNDPVNFYRYDEESKINEYTDTYEYLLYRSIKHLFYTDGVFYSGSILVTSSLAGLPDDFYVVSVGQNFYGDRIKPGTFELTTEVAGKTIYDDDYGNLYVSQSGTPYYIGNVFYTNGIAVIKQDTGSAVTSIGPNGLKLVQNSEIYVDYSNDAKIQRHQVNVILLPSEFNFSPFNPSILSTFEASSSVSQSFVDMNIRKTTNDNNWNLYNLMGAGVIKPYVTSIGLYNDKYELLAVAKFNQPIQRTFDADQIFIIKFDV